MGCFQWRNHSEIERASKWSDECGGKFKWSTSRYYSGSQQSSNLAFHPLHPLLASGGHRQGVLIWNIPQGSLLAQLEGHTAIVRAVAFSPDGALLATISGSEGFLRMSVQILFCGSGTRHTLLARVRASDYSVESIAFSRDSKWIAIGNWRGQIKLWYLPDICHACE